MRRKAAAPITFVVDEDTGPSAAEGIEAAGGQAVLLTDKVGKGAKDVDWLPRVKDFGDALVTRDLAMRVQHKEALAACGVHVFMVRAHGVLFDELRALMHGHHGTMCRHVRNQALPFIARVTRNDVVVVETAGRRAAQRKD